MKNINVRSIPHHNQLYPTVGDWRFQSSADALNVMVSDTGDWRMNTLVAVHEIIEASLCKARGIKEQDVTEFDLKFEEMREQFGEGGAVEGEPGDAYLAPYKKEHQFATDIERLFARELGVDWDEYERVLENLDAPQ